MRIVRILSVFALLSLVMACGWASEDDAVLKTVSGKIIDMDSIKSMMTVRYEDPVSGEANEMNILVPEDAKIMTGTETDSFLDLEQFDPVTVTYYDDDPGGLRAKEILVLNQANK